MQSLDSPISDITQVGETTARRLRLLGLFYVEDLLFYLPYRYDNFETGAGIEALKPGTSANIVGTIEIIQNKRSPRKRMNITEAIISDDSANLKVIWFNQPFLTKTLKVGDKISLSGKVTADYTGPSMVSPQYEKINPGSEANALHTQGLVPNYHLTANITQKQIRFMVSKVIDLADNVEDWIPSKILKRQKLLSMGAALKKIHFPASFEEAEQARKRFAFNEMFVSQCISQTIKEDAKKHQAPIIKFQKKATKDFVDSLPFKLTDAQRKAAWEIIQDMGKNQPMTRMLEGDVGSGKTIVAALVMLNAVMDKKLNGQAVLMVPTEILAHQHYQSFCKLFKDIDVSIGLVTRGRKENNLGKRQKTVGTRDKKTSPSAIRQLVEATPHFKKEKDIVETAQIIIGTHALIQSDICFKNLVLAIIDEQHRFGVEQRRTLLKKSAENKLTKDNADEEYADETLTNHANNKSPLSKGETQRGLPFKKGDYMPHLLSMTATPIPRSLALALYGDLDISIINQMPTGRKPIITHVVPETKRNDAYSFIKKQLAEGRQVFVICPLIDESDKLGVKSVKEEFAKLDKQIFPDIDIAMLHGRLKSKEKEEIMADFQKNKTKILVSTSVVEVGVDIPNATIMMIEGADRFGLAQLYQFRGRVGRGNYQSYCFLFSDNQSDRTIDRLNAMSKFNDGLSLAKEDLKHRGPGEIFGTSQKGFPEFKVASLFDYELIKAAKNEAEELFKNNPKLENLANLKEKITSRSSLAHME